MIHGICGTPAGSIPFRNHSRRPSNQIFLQSTYPASCSCSLIVKVVFHEPTQKWISLLNSEDKHHFHYFAQASFCKYLELSDSASDQRAGEMARAGLGAEKSVDGVASVPNWSSR
jgi:hypothetical protein